MKRNQNRKASRAIFTNLYYSPCFLFVLFFALLFFVDSAILYIIRFLNLSFPAWVDVFVNPILLVLVIFPILYFFLLRPLLRTISELDQSENVKSALFEISEASSCSRDLDELYSVIHQQLGKLIDTHNFYIALYHEEDDIYSFPYRVDEYDEEMEFSPQQLRKSLTDHVRKTGTPLLIDRETHQQLVQNGELEMVGTPAALWLGAPLITKKGTIGVAAVQSYTDPLLYSEKDLELMTFISDQIASAIERKQAEDSLRKLSHAVEQSPNAVIITDVTANIEYVNPKFLQLTGYLPEEVIGENPRIVKSGELSTGEYHRLWKTITSGGQWSGEFHNKKKNGEMYWVSANISPVRNENGETTHFIGIQEDITSRKKAEEALKESEEKFRSVVNTAREAIISADATGKIVLWNKTAEKMFGYTLDEALGQELTMIIPEQFRQPRGNAMRRVVDTGKSKIIGKTVETRGLKKDGTEIPVELSLVSWKVGGDLFFSSVIRDITERQKIECMKDEFVSTVSHELRTPLTSIYGSLSLINKGLMGELPDQVKQLIEIAGRNSERLKFLVDDILDIQKLEAGKMEFDMAPLELEPLVKQSIVENESFGKQFNVEFVMGDILSEVKVNADSNRLAQVMNNLLSNAAKFSPPDSSVEVSVVRHDGAARVTVKDHGAGIPEEYQSRMFQKFTQAESIFNRETKGTGLGLSIAKAIIEGHGGKIGFETEIDEGTTFYFELPEWKGKKDEDKKAK